MPIHITVQYADQPQVIDVQVHCQHLFLEGGECRDCRLVIETED